MRTIPTDAMNVDESAGYLRVSSQMIRKLCALGQMPHIRIGKRVILFRPDLDRWVESRKLGIVEAPVQ